MTPKEFITGLLKKDHIEFNYRRRTWGTTYGSNSTIELASEIAKIFYKKDAALDRWANFIEGQAVLLCRQEISTCSSSSFMSSRLVKRDYFGPAAKEARIHKLTTIERPFLFNIVHGVLSQYQETDGDDDADMDDGPDAPSCVDADLSLERNSEIALDDGGAGTQSNDLQDSSSGNLEDVLAEYGGFLYSSGTNEVTLDARQKRNRHIASVICSMVSFAGNRRHNGLQLENSIRFYACGVSETVNEYLHYLGLTSHRKTAVHALRSLASEAQDKVASCMALSNHMAPILCIDNLDMEERIQLATVGKQNRMFHGTWGYIHLPSKNLMQRLDPNEITLKAYHDSLRGVGSLVIDPNMFLPSDDDQDHYIKVVKSQIARAMHKYVARPSNPKGRLPLDPPDLDLISHEKPEIHMLQLMNESDNSAEGIGQVMDALQRQSRLDPEEFFGRLQLIDGDLGTAQIFNAIRVLRSPSEYCDHSLNNISFTLGAAHTLWNIAHTILTYHFGNSSSMDDLGVWRYLEALGIPPENVAQKKDFTKMLQYMEQVHEATLWYCLRYLICLSRNSWYGLLISE
ncbi:hypothetical protein PGT21_012446 [Puccinia graminis f. sp. tritici]|uniref:DUF6589 domain-containing protein n=1 Tax=Puccinia graminis f. sp. tritici TaxID=56615 RepID=A0A5B0NJ00_PUCGR|nr:hypothetical protein PGT21_012446 [Puccinia graminis f. sp. tritici]